jgi:hypothetical protein
VTGVPDDAARLPRWLPEICRQLPAVAPFLASVRYYGHGEKTGPPQPTTWTIYKIVAKAVRLGTVEAPDEAIAVEKAAAEFKVPANRLMAIRR